MAWPSPLPGHQLGSIDLDALLWSSTTPVLKIALMAAVGVVAARKGLLGHNSREALNAMVFNIFTPALIFYNIGSTVTPGRLLHWWPLLVNLLLNTAVGLLLGWLVCKVVPQTPAHMTNVVLAATSMGNKNNLPLVLTAAIIGQAQGSLRSAFSAVSPETALGYVAVIAATSTLLRYSIGFHLMKSPVAVPNTPEETGNASAAEEAATAAAGASGSLSVVAAAAAAPAAAPGSGSWKSSREQQTVVMLPEKARLPPLDDGSLPSYDDESPQTGDLIKAMPEGATVAQQAVVGDSTALATSGCAHITETESTPLLGVMNQSSSSSSSDIHSNSLQSSSAEPTGRQQAHTKAAASFSILVKAKQATPAAGGGATARGPLLAGSSGLQPGVSAAGSGREDSVRPWHRTCLLAVQPLSVGLAKPPMLAFGAALFVVCIPALQRAIFAPKAALSLIGSCSQTFAACAVPCMIMNLGAVMERGPGAGSLPWQVIAAVSAARLMVLPVLGLLWVLGGYFAEVYAAPDPMFILVMLVINTMPTGLNLHAIAMVNHNAEAEVGCLLFWQYCIAFFALPFVLMGYLLLAQAYFAVPLVDDD